MVWLLAFATTFLLSLVLSTVSPLIGTSSVLGPCLGCALDEVQDAGLLDEDFGSVCEVMVVDASSTGLSHIKVSSSQPLSESDATRDSERLRSGHYYLGGNHCF